MEYYGVAYGLQRFDRTAAPYSILACGAALWHSIHPVVVCTITLFRHDLNFARSSSYMPSIISYFVVIPLISSGVGSNYTFFWQISDKFKDSDG